MPITRNLYLGALIAGSLVLSSCKSPLFNHQKTSLEERLHQQRLMEQNLLFFPREGLYAQVKWLKGPVVDDLSTLQISFLVNPELNIFKDPRGRLAFEIWMPDHGHGSSPVEIFRIKDGVFEIREIFFSMKGKWELRFGFKDGKDEIYDQNRPVLRL